MIRPKDEIRESAFTPLPSMEFFRKNQEKSSSSGEYSVVNHLAKESDKLQALGDPISDAELNKCDNFTQKPQAPRPSEDTSDDRLLAQAHLNGDPLAFEKIVKKYRQPVYRMAMRWARNGDEAYDLTQRTFLRLLDHIQDFQTGQLRSYLFRITANLCKNHLRDTARFVFGMKHEPSEEQDFHRLELDEERVILRRMIQQLPMRQRQVVTLRVDGDLPFSEVARILGITENSTKVNFHHALKRLQKIRAEEEAALEKKRKLFKTKQSS